MASIDLPSDIQRETSLEELNETLNLTIKYDYATKLILFLASLLTYTDKEQVNLIIGGESSIGKTYNVHEILWFFPKNEDVLEIHGASRTSFIHEPSAILVDSRTMTPINFSYKPKEGDSKEVWDNWHDLMRNKAYFLDYSKKIIVLPDMPDTKLLATIRSLLSHDQNRCEYRVTESKTLRTKKVFIEGFFTTIFCTSSTELNEQEITRHFLLTPEDSEEKEREAINLIARKNSDLEFQKWYESEPKRNRLQQRVQKIKSENIREIFIPSNLMENLKNWFIEKVKLKPKSKRDFPRLIALAKAWCLFNVWNRLNDIGIPYVNATDIEVAKRLYSEILESNEHGLSPENWNLYLKVVFPIANNSVGATIDEIHRQYYVVNKRQCSDYRLKGMLKNLETAGLITKETSSKPHRYFLIHESKDDSEKVIPIDEFMPKGDSNVNS